MLTRALDAGVPARWATADEFYGGDRGLRRDLQARGVGLRARRGQKPPGHPAHRGLQARPGHRPACTGVLEPALRRQGRQGRTRLRLGLAAHHPTRRRGGRAPLAARAPPHQRRRARLLPLLVTHPRHPRQPSSASPAPAGASRSASRPARARSASTSTRSAGGAPGTATPPSSCSPTPSSPSSPRTNATASPPPDELIPLTVNEIRHLFAKLITTTGPHHQLLAALVHLAPPTPAPRPDQPLPKRTTA